MISLMLHRRTLHLLTLLASLGGYLAWGGGNSGYLYQMEYDILFGSQFAWRNFVHPAIGIPLLGQLLLAAGLFVQNRWITRGGILAISVLYALVLVSGVLSLNIRIAGSVVPFFVCAVLLWKTAVRKPAENNATNA
jgi:hypothetical protein